MAPKVNIKAASTSALQVELGASLKLHIKAWGAQKEFQVESGIPMNTLHRMMRGETVGSDVLLTVLRTLGRFDLIEQLLAEPPKSPLDDVPRKNKRDTSASVLTGASRRPKAGELTGIARPVRTRTL